MLEECEGLDEGGDAEKGTVIKFIRSSMLCIFALFFFPLKVWTMMMMVEVRTILMLMAFPKEHTCAAHTFVHMYME